MKAERVVEISDEERAAREEIGQLAGDGRTIPSPTLIVFTGETQYELEALAKELELTPEGTVAYALQRLKQHQDVLMGRVKPEPQAEPERAKPAEPEKIEPDRTAFAAW